MARYFFCMKLRTNLGRGHWVEAFLDRPLQVEDYSCVSKFIRS